MKEFNECVKYEELSMFKDFFLKSGKYREMKKKEYLTQQGFTTSCAAYITKGIFRFIRTDENGDEHVVGYSFAGEYVGDYPWCLKNEEAMISIQAVTDSHIYCASSEEIKNFLLTNKATMNLERVLAEGLFVQTYRRLLDIYCKTPTQLYLDLFMRYPDFQNYITLREVASFLRVTPETISHIRRTSRKQMQDQASLTDSENISTTNVQLDRFAICLNQLQS